MIEGTVAHNCHGKRINLTAMIIHLYDQILVQNLSCKLLKKTVIKEDSAVV